MGGSLTNVGHSILTWTDFESLDKVQEEADTD